MKNKYYMSDEDLDRLSEAEIEWKKSQKVVSLEEYSNPEDKEEKWDLEDWIEWAHNSTYQEIIDNMWNTKPYTISVFSFFNYLLTEKEMYDKYITND